MICLKHYYSLGLKLSVFLHEYKSISILSGRNVDSEKKEESIIYIYRWTEGDGKR